MNYLGAEPQFSVLADAVAVVSHCLPHSFPYMSLFLSSPEPILFRLAFENQEASHYHQNPREVSFTRSSPYKTLPRPPRDPRSMPPTPVMTRNAYSSSHLRCDLRFAALVLKLVLLQSPASVVETFSKPFICETLSPQSHINLDLAYRPV